MKTATFNLFFFTVILILVFQNTKASTIESKIIKQSNVEKKDTQKLSESDTYKLLYENAKENNDRMLTMMQWVIGISIAFLLALLGGQVFFNWRLNKKEIDYIKIDLEEKIGELKAELIKDFTQTEKDKNVSFNITFEKFTKEIKTKIDKQFEEKEKVLKLENQLREKDIEILKKEIDIDFKKLKIDITKNTGDLWKLKGVESNALTSYLKTAFLENELGKEMKYILSDIINVLKIRQEIHQSDYNQLDILLKSLDSKYDNKKEEIISLYKDKPVYIFETPKSIQPGTLGSIYTTSEKTYILNKPS